MKSLCIAAFVTFSGALAIVACSSSSSPPVAANDSGTPTDTGSPGDTSTAGDGAVCAAVGTGAMQYSTGNATCDSCLGSSCCSVFTTCVNSAPCLAALKCTTACVKSDGGTTTSCGLMCINANMGSGGDALMLSECQSNSCATQC
jgi:hypothetical protein